MTLMGGICRSATYVLAIATLSGLSGFTTRNRFSGPPPAKEAEEPLQVAMASSSAARFQNCFRHEDDGGGGSDRWSEGT